MSVREWQLFAKALRKRVGAFRFYQVGEYGDASLRPHYHALLFGVDFHEDRELVKKKPNPVYWSPTLESVWGKGHCAIGDLTVETCRYVAKYVMKKRTGPMKKPAYERVDAETGEVWQVSPETSSMSLKPGIGAGWLEKYRDDVYPEDEVVFRGGRKTRPPRFYDKMVEDWDSQLMESIREKRREAVKRRSKELTPSRLKVRHLAQSIREGRKQREIT